MTTLQFIFYFSEDMKIIQIHPKNANPRKLIANGLVVTLQNQRNGLLISYRIQGFTQPFILYQ